MTAPSTEPRRTRRIRSPFVRFSIGLHAAAPFVLALAPLWWRPVVAALVADHLALVTAGLVPKSRLLGPNTTRLAGARAEVALTFDDGPDPATTPGVLDALARAGGRASFFCVGRRAESHPGLVRAIAEAGHAVENHSWSHRNAFALLRPREVALEIDRAQRLLARLAGRPPRWFRAPAGVRSPWLDPLLARRGLELASWSRRGFDTVLSEPRRVLARLTRDLRPGAVLLLHDGPTAARCDGRAVALHVVPELLAVLARRGLEAVALPRPDDAG